MGILRKLVREGTEVVVVAPVDTYIHYLHHVPTVRHISLKHLNPQGKGFFKSLFLLWELCNSPFYHQTQYFWKYSCEMG